MDPQKITELANLLRNNGDKILNSEFTLTLSGGLLRALNDSFTLIADTVVDIRGPQNAAPTFEVVKPNNSKSPVFRDLQLIHDFVQKTTLLCIVHYPVDEYFEGVIDISKFHALQRLEVQKTNVCQIVGIQPLRAQLQQLICVKSLRNVEDIITHCGGDNSNGFVWNELKIADFSYNNLQSVDSSLEFAQYLQHLNLRHNQLHSVEAIKWLPQLKTLDLSYNRLQCVPQLHMEACKRLQSLNMSHNFVEDLMGIAKLDSLTDLDLSDNLLLDHTHLLPLSALVTLRYLNLYGNPLYFHPKHRLATAQFLHKNTATVQFILDFEPLSRREKAITGSQQMRHVGSLNRYISKSSSVSLGRPTPPGSMHTPASSVGSLRSFIFRDTSTASDVEVPSMAESQSKKRPSKVRTVEIEEELSNKPAVESVDAAMDATTPAAFDKDPSNDIMTQSLIEEESANTELQQAKKHIETLREKYGAEWLQSSNAEVHSVLGIATSPSTTNIDIERDKSRQLFNDYLGEFSTASTNVETTAANDSTTNPALPTSTPTNTSLLTDTFTNDGHLTPIKPNGTVANNNDTTLYVSANNSNASASQTLYESADESGYTTRADADSDSNYRKTEDDEAEAAHLKYAYSTNADEAESEASEPENDELTYIVYTANHNEAIFLTISSNCLRERDTLTQRTKTKWSLKMLESCDRIKSNTLRINFDTVKVDKQERIYTVEDDLCQELERKLRDILSQRDLSEINQTIYRCVQCSCQFSHENNLKTRPNDILDIRCPDCRSTFVVEIQDIPKSLEKSAVPRVERLSPAAIIEELPVTTPLVVQLRTEHSALAMADSTEDTNSIGKGRSTLHAINTQFNRSLKKSPPKSSATSLNESSSCSKITANSQSSFDSNQSVVGSSNTDRDNEFKANCDSDVDILSNPSQSSIEVLDQTQHSSRKTSEERRISQLPNLETINDLSYHDVLQRIQQTASVDAPTTTKDTITTTAVPAPPTTTTTTTTTKLNGPASGHLAQFQLTESSSSGSVTDSICTAYQQQVEQTLASPAAAATQEEIAAIHNFLAEQGSGSGGGVGDSGIGVGVGVGVGIGAPVQQNESKSVGLKREESSTSVQSVFGALLQSTNRLMSSSKKLEAMANIQTGQVLPSPVKGQKSQASVSRPYKFNYNDFNDIDHRLKLYFYQTKFGEVGEHFKWIVRGRIYNENTHTLADGVVVMSTCKCYLLEAYAPENDDVTKWLRQVVSVTIDRLERIQLLPWKIGLSFTLRDWGGFLLLLQDILRTDSLLLHFVNDSLPSQCTLDYQPAEQIVKRINTAVLDEKLHMCCLLNGCEIVCDNAKRTFSICGLLTTDAQLYLTTSEKLGWLSLQPNTLSNADVEHDLELCVTQFMSNLVEVERSAENCIDISFLDETHGKCELWKCTFVTRENAECCLNAIGQSWEKLFGVPLFSST